MRKRIELRLEEDAADIGVVCDVYGIYDNGVRIGWYGKNVMSDGATFIEYLEMDPEFRGQHRMKAVVKALKAEYSVIEFDCSEELKPMWEHLGALVLTYDADREMYAMSIV